MAFSLKRITAKGYKSFDSEGVSLEPEAVTVLLGANGAGKSNFVSLFKMLNFLTTGSLQNYIASQGFAEPLLYYGSKTTGQISVELVFSDGPNEDTYSLILERDERGGLFIADETISYHSPDHWSPQVLQLGSGLKESVLPQPVEWGDATRKFIFSLLSNCRVFQFHDTSSTAKIRERGYINDNRYLRSDGGNLAAFLRVMREGAESRKYYDRVVRHIRVVVPQFGDFVLEPSADNREYIRLDWRETDSDYLFSPSQLSDGTLRFMALSALFLQPPETLPKLIIVDEPELGLHPAAIAELAAMIKSASRHCQVLLATQSPRFIDEFGVGEIVVAERDERRSTLRRLDTDSLKEWLARYSLSELWDKNVLGGRP